MVGLLDLPLELREPILLDVVVDTIEVQPENPDSVGFFRGYHEFCGYWSNRVFCKPLRRHAMALLQINQQIRYEVIDIVLRRLGQRFNDAKVDVIYVQDGMLGTSTSLCATWLSVPFPTSNLNSLHVQIRCFQTFERQVHGWGSRYLVHPWVDITRDCHHWLDSQTADTLLDFVRGCLQAQAGNAASHEYKEFSGAHESRPPDRKIQKLVIDIPFESDSRYVLGERVRCIYCPRRIIDFSNNYFRPIVPSGKRAALILAQSLHERLLQIFDTVPKHRGQDILPSTIFESVGTIELNVQGRLFRSLDLSRMLAKMPHSEEWNELPFSRAKFFEWKRVAEEKRKAAGFEVVKPSVQECNLVGSAGLISSMLAARDETLVLQRTLPPNDPAPSTLQGVAFKANAVLVQEDGTKFSGDATFYTSTSVHRETMIFGPSRMPPFGSFRELDLMGQDIEEQILEERPMDGEHVVFRAEAIFIATCHGNKTINSGDATFYGRAEGAST